MQISKRIFLFSPFRACPLLSRRGLVLYLCVEGSVAGSFDKEFNLYSQRLGRCF